MRELTAHGTQAVTSRGASPWMSVLAAAHQQYMTALSLLLPGVETQSVQLICGAHDVRCPASESRQGYDKLIALGKDCEYHLYADEGHSFLKIENQVKEKTQQAAFLARYLEKPENQ